MTRHAAVEAVLARMQHNPTYGPSQADKDAVRAALTAAAEEAVRRRNLRGVGYDATTIAREVAQHLLGEDSP